MSIYQHFRPEEQPFVDLVLGWKDDVETQYKTVLTDFLDPREQLIFESVIGKQSDLNLTFFGGYDKAERKRAILAPFYEVVEKEDYSITVLEGHYPTKFMTITHRDVLGSLMSLGVMRKKIGDIIVNHGTIQILVDAQIDTFLINQFKKIKNGSIDFKQISSKQMIRSDNEWEEKQGTVSSMRLDVMIKEIYNLSRQKSQQLIEKEFVKVNHRIVTNPAFVTEPGDLISVRKFGRSKVTQLNGVTRKNNLIVKYEKLN